MASDVEIVERLERVAGWLETTIEEQLLPAVKRLILEARQEEASQREGGEGRVREMLTDEEINTLFVQVRDSIADLHDLRSTFARAIEREVLRKVQEIARRVPGAESGTCRVVIDVLEGRWKP